MEKQVTEIIFNWRQIGSVTGDDYNKFVVGESGVVYIQENEPKNGMQLWNYVVLMEDGIAHRIFNPNMVSYK